MSHHRLFAAVCSFQNRTRCIKTSAEHRIPSNILLSNHKLKGLNTVNFPFTLEMRDVRVTGKRAPYKMLHSSGFCCINQILSMSDFCVVSMFPEIRHAKNTVRPLYCPQHRFSIIKIRLNDIDIRHRLSQFICFCRFSSIEHLKGGYKSRSE
jgi:hypothetical protein